MAKTPPRPTTSVGIHRETLELIDRICEENRKLATRSHRWSRQEELHYLVVEEARKRGLLDPKPAGASAPTVAAAGAIAKPGAGDS